LGKTGLKGEKMAKVIFAPTISYMSGKLGEGVFSITKKPGISLIKKYTYPKITTHNNELGANVKNLSHIFAAYVTPYYKKEAKKYADEISKLEIPEKPHKFRSANGMNYFIQSIVNAKKSGIFPMDISEITYYDIQIYGDPIICIAEAARNGFLQKTKNSDTYTATM